MQAKLQLLHPSHIISYNSINLSCEVSTHFRSKEREYSAWILDGCKSDLWHMQPYL